MIGKSFRTLLRLTVIFCAVTMSAYMIWRQAGAPVPKLGGPPANVLEAAAAADRRLAARRLARGLPVYIRIFKQESQLELWLQKAGRWRLFDTFSICKWSGRLGPKLREGDRQAPEGFYSVTRASLNPYSSNYLAFNLGFPNAFDRAHGRTGSHLMVHGDCQSIGCYAMTDAGIAVIYGLVDAALKNGQASVPVHIFPFQMTEKNLSRHARSKWQPFWRQLRPAWQQFELTRNVPGVQVIGKRYVIGRPDA